MGDRLKQLIGWVVLVAAVIGIIYPAFFDQRLSLTQILISLSDFDHVSVGFLMRWLCVIILVGTAYILITNWLYRNLPISVIWTRLDIYFDTDDGAKVRIAREQALRANQPGVTAYFMSCRPNSETGRVPAAEINCSVHCANKPYHGYIDLHGTDVRGYEIEHGFNAALPYAWYMPLIPIWLLNRPTERLFSPFRRRIPTRRMSITYLNEFNLEKATMSFIAAVYPQHNVAIYLHFPTKIARDLKAKRIKSNGVVNVHPREQDDLTFSFYLDRLENETFRITWNGLAK